MCIKRFLMVFCGNILKSSKEFHFPFKFRGMKLNGLQMVSFYVYWYSKRMRASRQRKLNNNDRNFNKLF